MEPRSNIEKPKDRRHGNNRNKKKDQQQYIFEIAALESDIFPDPWSEKSIMDTLENPQARIWAIISRQAPSCSCASKGAGACRQATTPWLCDFYYVLDEGEIARIATSPQHRRQGVAVRLLEKKCVHLVTSRILQDGCWMFVFPMKQQYIFTKAAGFAKDGVRKNFYANPPEDAILMSCEVGTSGSDRA